MGALAMMILQSGKETGTSGSIVQACNDTVESMPPNTRRDTAAGLSACLFAVPIGAKMLPRV
jgi:hypothetical protein